METLLKRPTPKETVLRRNAELEKKLEDLRFVMSRQKIDHSKALKEAASNHARYREVHEAKIETLGL